jgi:UDP-hydrolysing UDP-N-acetyl-D-glucosamine 2-epimerase
MKKRKVCVVVTARPSYSRVKSALKSIQSHPDLELQLVVTASALLDRYGSAVNYIVNDGFEISAKVFNIIEGENLTAAAKTTGIGIVELSSVFDNLKPDMVVTIADRFETMSTAIAASYMNIPLVHIQGGEVTGNIDEKVRHAITKLADIHLVASEKAKSRVIKMGEYPEKVFKTGCPSIDLAKEVINNSKLDFDPYAKYGGVGHSFNLDKGYLVVMQHPVTNEYNLSRVQIETTLEAISNFDMPVFWFWPNVDAGSDGTSKGIRAYREHNTEKVRNIRFFKNMEPNDFLKLLINSKCLIGNSSVGIREGSFLGIPVVNIGSRQSGRERGESVIDVDYDSDGIYNAIQTQLSNGVYIGDPIYGDGYAGEKIADILSTVDLSINKKLNY